MTDWTKQQKEAIEARNSHLLVSAAAGSGKTAVLVARIMDMMVKEKMDIDSMLIVTFTHAAAAEMREKILRALTERMDEEGVSSDMADFLRRQMNRLNRASIETLHGFCIEVIRAGFHVVDLDPEFRIADDLERSMLRDEALEELLEESYARRDPSFLNLIEAFCGNKDDEAFKEMVKKLHGFVKSMPEPWTWMRNSVDWMGQSYEEFLKGPWIEEIRGQLIMELKEIADGYGHILKTAREPDGPHEYEETLLSDFALVAELTDLAENDLEAYVERISGMQSSEFVKRKSLNKTRRQEVDEGKEAIVKKGRDDLKKQVLTLGKRYFDCPLKTAHGHLALLKPDMEFLARFTESLDGRYLEKKAERRLLDFNDLEHFALEILGEERIARRFRTKYRQIFIDEYQDNNRMQEALIERIGRPDNVFMVGDVKQSIYRFRLAEPGIFISKYHRYASEGADGRRIVLNRNFRSREVILEAVNYIFGKIMNPVTGEIEYDGNARLNAGRSFGSERDESVEIHLLEKVFDEENGDIDEEIAELNHSQAEAILTARLIKRLLGEQTYDPGLKEYRPILCRDIVVLSRAAKNWVDIFHEEFTKEGIPVYTDNSGGYFETLEIKLLVDLLKLIDNRRQDVALLSVLRSPIGGFSIEELTSIRLAFPAGPYYEGAERYQRNEEDAVSVKLGLFYEKIDRWAQGARYMKLDDFIWLLVRESGYMAYVSAMPGGTRRRENLKMLLDRAGTLSGGSGGSLFEFIRFIEDVLKSRGDMDTASILGEKDNVVRMMTVHKSKGLEFPVVILTGLGKQMKRRNSRNDILMHRDLGLGPKYYDMDKRIHRESLPQTAIRNRSFKESVAEEMRILYVAMTRASDRLFLVGSVRDRGKAFEKWAGKLTDFSILNASSYFDWVMGSLSDIMTEEDVSEALSGTEVRLEENGRRWRLRVHDRTTLSMGAPEAKDPILRKRVESFDFDCEPSMAADLDKKLSWRYPYASVVKMPSKMTVTALNRLQSKEGLEGAGFAIPSLVKKPMGLEESRVPTPREIGNYYHGVMQHLKLNGELAEDAGRIDGQFRDLAGRGIIKPEALPYLDSEVVRRFFDSPLGRRLLASKNVHREVPFVLRKESGAVLNGDGTGMEGDDLLVQGIIDCYFEEEDGWVLVDYKTGNGWKEGLDAAAEAYSTQIAIYKEALEGITGRKVRDAYLYFFGPNKEVRVP